MFNNPKTISPRPLGCLNAAMRDLDLDAARVCEMIDVGQLIAFNIAVKTSGRPALRILTRSIEHCQASGSKKPLVLVWPEIFRLILPHEKPFLRGLEIQRGLNCDRGHVENLILAGLLGMVNKRSRPGPGGSPIIASSSLENFLIGRLQ
jgi:hypothetical protein